MVTPVSRAFIILCLCSFPHEKHQQLLGSLSCCCALGLQGIWDEFVWERRESLALSSNSILYKPPEGSRPVQRYPKAKTVHGLSAPLCSLFFLPAAKTAWFKMRKNPHLGLGAEFWFRRRVEGFSLVKYLYLQNNFTKIISIKLSQSQCTI